MARPPKSKRLQPIQRMAELNEERAAKALADIQARIAAETGKLAELVSFSDEYIAQLAPGAGTHTAAQLANWHQFFARLQLAIRQQEQLLKELQHQSEKLLEAWRAQHLKRKSMDKVILQSRIQEEAQREKRLQRELDDRSAQKARSP